MAQFIRLQRICREDKVFEEEKWLMNGRFLSQGYESGTIQRTVNIVDTIQRESLYKIKKRKRSSVGVPVFHTPYSLEFHKIIRRIIERHIPIIYEDDVYANIFVQRG